MNSPIPTRAPIRDLASLWFRNNAANVLFLGPPGVCKTTLTVRWRAAAL
ncbi:hypothetical protein DFR75_10434 [Nocardia ignorata]|uniref:IstB-like ATP-binding domain-containing protein n=1 Tax=Nocardia ignorata TaxID=145285 RepID=A0A4R6PHB2_NOCIG|nr:hypothetical protein DFR75_10434 [Nocardia ignorata]